MGASSGCLRYVGAFALLVKKAVLCTIPWNVRGILSQRKEDEAHVACARAAGTERKMSNGFTSNMCSYGMQGRI